MDNKEELKRSLAEEEQRAKDSLANVEKMKKQLEELNKKEVEVSATGVILTDIPSKPTKNILFCLNLENKVFDNYFDIFSNFTANTLKINNAFITKEQAEQEALRREGQEFIRRCAMLWNRSKDWRIGNNEYKHILYYSIGREQIDISTYDSLTFGVPCFDTIELAKRCTKELNGKYNKEQQKTIFGVI